MDLEEEIFNFKIRKIEELELNKQRELETMYLEITYLNQMLNIVKKIKKSYI